MLDSDPASQQRRDLVAPPGEICDFDALKVALQSAVADLSDGAAQRLAIVQTLKDVMHNGRQTIAAAVALEPLAAREAVASYAYLTDSIVIATFEIAVEALHPRPTPTSGERIALLAVGGSGRGEMAPYSDVDLLFLTPVKSAPWTESLIESMLYIFWDLHLKVGHASRTTRDCLRLAREDYTIRTALLENRYLAGETDLAEELNTRLWKELFTGTSAAFIEAKLGERDVRHERHGGHRYVVEPNVKEGKGGLRDLQTLFWIAKYERRVEDVSELVASGTFSQEEYDRFRDAETFLMAVRNQLHLIADRAMDQLTFDMQVEVADRLGYADKDGRRAVEHFMQDYFRHATEVGELTRILLTELEARHTREAPFARLLRRRKSLRSGFRLVNNRITYAREDHFLKDPLNFLRIFEEAVRTGYLLHPNALRTIRANLEKIDKTVRDSPEARQIFLDMLLKHANPERALRRMNEIGVLAQFLPEFAPIVAMMQFNMYHSYTVDEHTIQCIAALAMIERGELIEELPVASRILKEGVNRKVLYVALLLHDIGKGRLEDHSILGAKIARKVAPRLGLKKDEAETVEWLVRYHLLMSDMAQKRDTTDPRTIRGFANAVKSKKRLDLLTVLTVCDIRGVGPDTWNNWKAQLIRSLYRDTAAALETGLEDINRGTRETEAKRALREALPDWSAKALKAETSRHYGPYWQGIPTSAHLVFANLLHELDGDQVRIDLLLDEDRDATRACFALEDHPGIFARVSGALALVGANVVDARTYTSKDGYATAVFWVQDADGRPYEASRHARLEAMILKTLKGEVVARDAFKDKDRIKKRERAFKVPTTVTFDNEGSEIYTIIEVDTRDRPGLLYDLTRCLAASNVYISSAVIATYGEQVVDTFYVKDMFGLKFHAEAKRKTLEKRLLAAIEQGAERARG